MQENKDFTPENNNNIKISEEVIITIASVSISEIDGVSGTGMGIVEGIAKIFTKKPLNGGIKVTISENNVIIDINVIMNYGVRIPEVAWNIQEAVKKEVELMTGLSVEKVNVRVVGIDIPQEEAKDSKVVDVENTTDD